MVFQVRSADSEIKRERRKKNGWVRGPTLRKEGYKSKIEDTIANNEIFSCEGFDERAAKLEEEFREIMASV